MKIITGVCVVLFSCALEDIQGIYSNETLVEENPALWTEQGPWSSVLEDWALGNRREKRVMHFNTPGQTGFIAIERIDILQPPQRPTPTPIPLTPLGDLKMEEKAKIAGGPTKIVNHPPANNYYNQQKPITHLQQISPSNPRPSISNAPPGRVSETDVYLLGAIEKLVYRVDFMEKRLRRVEEMMYYVMAGNRVDQDSCPVNFTRAGHGCYQFASQAGREVDWKVASKLCRKQGALLVEMESFEENQDLVAHIQTNSHLQGKDFWTGGLNPGLLWIWSNSARPVATSATDNRGKNNTIAGDGRCLRMAYNPALRSYAYKGTDCSVRYSYICEKPDTTSSNEIKRIGRERKIFDN